MHPPDEPPDDPPDDVPDDVSDDLADDLADEDLFDDRADGEGPGAADAGRAGTAAKRRARAVVRELVLYPGATLPPLAEVRIRALAEAAARPLIAVLIDSKLRDPQGPGEGWGPVHAARLLGQLFPERAVEALIDVLATTDQLSPLWEAVTAALSPLGPLLVAPILARLPTAVGAYRRELWHLLAGIGVRDPRVFAQLLSALAESPEEGAMRLLEYGDKDALPDLSRALDSYPMGLADDTRGDSTVFELREAILGLGGKLSPAQEAKYQRAWWARRVEVVTETRTRRAPPVDPDAPCPCGSRRPHKLCCLQ